MASDTKNVKLGVCKITFGGADLGYTKGGVEVEVTTETHKTTVDQFGTTEISETIMGRTIKVKCPLAETTLDNMVRIMPGAIMVSDGAKASGNATFSGQPAVSDTLTVGTTVFTFKTVAAAVNEISIGATLAATIANAAQVINASALTGTVVASASATILTVTAIDVGAIGNAIALAKTGSAITVSGATLVGGADATKKRVEVTTGVGINLLDIAKELVLHPIARAEGDSSEDFAIPRAATPGALNFAYKVDEERIFNTEFSGYPDPATKVLFKVGDKTVSAV